MKLFLQLLITATVLIAAGIQPSKAQKIPNGGFENWIISNYDWPTPYNITSNPTAFYRCNTGFNVEKVADPYHGSYAIRLTTKGSGPNACFGFFINATTADAIADFRGGLPISEKPTGIRGYFKSAIPSGDSAFILLIFKAAGVSFASYQIKFYGTHSVYTSFSYTFPAPLPITPDSVIFGAASSDALRQIAFDGSMIQLDSISFTGVTTQPAQFNGSFENWQTATVNKPEGGWQMTDVINDAQVVFRSTDAFTGMYALELRSTSEIDDTGPYAVPTVLSLGGLDCSVSPCITYGGIPYQLQIDTLLLRYKFSSGGSGNTGYIRLLFKKAGVVFAAIGDDLTPSSSYTLKELPFQLVQIPDSVMIEIYSGDESLFNIIYANAVLKIDELKFKSDDTGTGLQEYLFQKFVKVYPNPSNGYTILYSDAPVTHLEITNIAGQRVHTQSITGNRVELNLTQQPKGVYIYKVFNKGVPVARGKLVIQ
jgi:hypothetical protein